MLWNHWLHHWPTSVMMQPVVSQHGKRPQETRQRTDKGTEPKYKGPDCALLLVVLQHIALACAVCVGGVIPHMNHLMAISSNHLSAASEVDAFILKKRKANGHDF